MAAEPSGFLKCSPICVARLEINQTIIIIQGMQQLEGILITNDCHAIFEASLSAKSYVSCLESAATTKISGGTPYAHIQLTLNHLLLEPVNELESFVNDKRCQSATLSIAVSRILLFQRATSSMETFDENGS
jgi:hypothetical protein